MWRYLLLFSVLVLSAQCAKVLVVFPMPSYSHYQLGFRIAKELADRGHQVTGISPYPQKTPIKNYKEISVEENIAIADAMRKNLFDTNAVNPFTNVKFVFDIGTVMTESTYNNSKVQELLNSGETFDIVIIEHFVNDAAVGFGHHFNAPVILIGSMGISSLSNYLFANPGPSSYIPNILASFTKHMNFWERTQNFLQNMMTDLVRELHFAPAQRNIFKKYIKTDLEMDDVLYNVSLMITNTHVSVTDAVPTLPNIIELGGFHINPPKKLSEALQKFLDESKEGVILFSMGSNLKSKNLKPEIRNSILRAFSKIKQQVLWKFEDDLPDAPKNVKVMKWIPQQDVMAHPNVQAFISHGGLLSTMEAVYFGVPIIGIPVFADQKLNIATASEHGYAVNIPLSDLSEEKLSWALEEILNNPKYRENVKQRSKVMHDRPLKPIDEAVFWVEHVIRHRGAPHFRSAGLDLRWYQRNMIDIILFLTLVTIILFVIFYIIIKRILGICFSSKPKITKAKKNK